MTREEQHSIADLRERLARMETNHKNLNVSLDKHMENIDKSITKMNIRLDELHDVHMKAKGARWALGASIPVISGIIGYIASHLPNLPK